MSNNNFNFTRSGYVTENNDFHFGDSYIAILAGNRNFVAIWADPTANIASAKMYVASAGTGAAFSVVNLATQELFDSYTITDPGIDNETLDAEDIVDINVGD